MENAIVAKNLYKTFLQKKPKRIKKTAVNNLSFEVKKGEVFGLLGPNGAGKTTTLRMLASLIKPDSGEIEVCGIDCINNSRELRQNIGFLTSELKLEDYFTPNFLFDYFSQLYKIDSKIAKERKQMLFDKFEINDYKDTKVEKLSTGMKQKVSLAVALVNDPDVIIFDEPTNGLDVITAKVVTDFLEELKNSGKTIIVSTHIFTLIEKVCDRVGIIIDGKMMYTETLENINKEKTLEDLFFEIYEQNKGVE